MEMKISFENGELLQIKEGQEIRLFRNYPVLGTNKRQLTKLSAAGIVEPDFYLTIDADIICARPTSLSNQARNGRLYCFKLNLEKPAERFKQWCPQRLQSQPAV